MPLQNCKQCGQLFLHDKAEYCTACQEDLSICYKRVRQYLKERPNSTLWDLHKQLGIPLSKLQLVLHEQFSPYQQ